MTGESPDAPRGLLLVDKPAGVTSHDVVARVRRAARTKRVGHAGTLDPFATGLLVVAVGAYTRLLPYVHGEPKVYDTVVRFGVATDTDDATGQEIASAALPGRDAVLDAIRRLSGTIEQVPPAFSAKHVDGKRAYEHARRGDARALPPVPVTVHAWERPVFDGDTLHARVVCAGGTYVRALARDLGALTGGVAHCAALRRVRSGDADVADAVPLEELAPGVIADGAVKLLAPQRFLGPVALVDLDDDGFAAIRHGRAVPSRDRADAPDESRADAADEHPRAALLRDGAVVAMAERIETARGRAWQPKVVFA